MLRRVRSDEGGWVLITAIALMTIMLGTSLALASFMESQTRQNRVRESSFNLAEAALNQQVWALSGPQRWPGVGYLTNSPSGYPTCTEASTDVRCPNASNLLKFIPTPDADPGAAWDTRIVDNSPAAYKTYYSDSALKNSPDHWDKNGDGFVWVRASATMKGKTRTLVALVSQEPQQEEFPRAAVLAGGLTFTNNGSNGNKRFINDGTGGIGVAVNCTPGPGDTASAPCLGWSPYDADKVNTAINPQPPKTNYNGGVWTPAISPDALQRLIDTAWTNKTYYTTCPTSLNGKVVVIDIHTACSVDGGNVAFNAPPAEPGLVILLNSDSQLTIAMNTEYYGVIYAPNLPDANLPGGGPAHELVVMGDGNPVIHGGVIIDGNGRLTVGSSGDQIVFDDNAFSVIRSIGGAGIIQNTWREIPKGS
jgi:hypothetical protein